MTKQITRIASGLFPQFFVNVAYDQLTNPQIRKLRERETKVLDTAIKEDFPFNEFNIKLYHWPGKKDNILLIHGWEGQAGNFSDLIIKLKAEGFNVYAFDGPSHGYSSKGPTSLFEFTELVNVLIRKFDARKLISHSFGGVATTYALYSNPDLNMEKYALITTPDKFTERIEDVSVQYNIHPKVVNKIIHKFESEFDVDVKKLNVSDYVKKVNVEDVMIIHDKNDKVIPIERSLNVHQNWNNSTFKTVEGTGHFRILRDEQVLGDVIDFIRD